MTMHIISSVVFAGLLIYIIILHIRLAKKNIFIETTVKRLTGIEKTRSMEEMMDFLENMYKEGQYRSYAPDKFLEESTTNFILENEDKLKIYMHYTRYEADAEGILKEGFRFVNSFYKTAVPVTRDKLDMIIKHNNQKFFGHYLIIIAISNDIVTRYANEIRNAGLMNFSFENLLTESPPSRNENSEPVYLLPHQYIKGFINHQTGEIMKNPEFDPEYNSPFFLKNIPDLS